MRSLKRLLIIAVVIAVLGVSAYQLYLSPRYTVPILTYHFIDYDRSSSLYVTPENFERQMGYLRKGEYNVISLGELVDGIRAKKRFPRNTVCITFDDGYEDNFTCAFPVLYKYKLPATVFLISDFMGGKKYLNWDQVRLMEKSGIDFGGHTANNAYLPSVKDDERLWDEIAGCKKAIEAKLGREISYFCYPTGGFTEEVKALVKKAGYKAACTTNRGSDRYNRDLYELKRIKVTNSDTNKPLSFRAKLSGYYNLFRSKRSPY